MTGLAPHEESRAVGALHLFVACGPWVLALRADAVERLVLPEEARLLDLAPSDGPPASLGRLEAGGLAYAAFDLGLLLGLAAQSEAWVLLSLCRPAGPLPLALRTGACLSVASLPEPRSALPEAVMRTRAGLFTSAFRPTRLRHGRGESAAAGLVLDLTRLLSDEEAAFADSARVAPAAEGA